MATINKHYKKWQAHVRKKGIRVVKSFWNKSDASAWAYKTEAQIETGTYRRVQEAERLSDIKLKEVLNIYYEKYLVLNSTDHKKEKYLIDHLSKKPIGNMYLSDITGSVLAKFRDHELEEEGRSNATVKKYLMMFSRAINKVKAEHNIPITVNPVGTIKMPAEPPPIDRILTREEWRKLLVVCAKSNLYFMKEIVIVARETLCRRGELLRLKWQDVNWEQATARINITKTKKPREIGLSPLAIATLRSLPRSTDGRFFPCNVNGFNSYWRKVLRAAELEGVFTFHRLRHQGATDLAESDWSIAELSAQGGWSSLASLKRYTHIQAKHLAKKMKTRA